MGEGRSEEGTVVADDDEGGKVFEMTEEVNPDEKKVLERSARVPPMPPTSTGPLQEAMISHWITVEAEVPGLERLKKKTTRVLHSQRIGLQYLQTASLPPWCFCCRHCFQLPSAMIRIPLVVGNIPLQGCEAETLGT